MKIQHIWSVLCKESVIDQSNNNVSIHGVLEQLSITVTPTEGSNKLPETLGIAMSYEIVSMWQRVEGTESAKGDIEYILIDPDKKELFNAKRILEISKTSRRFRSVMKITGLPLSKEGYYYFQVRIKEEGTTAYRLVSELPLEIKIAIVKQNVKQQSKK